MAKMMRIKLVHSACGGVPKHRETVKGLGFRKVNHERLIVDNASTRGMVKGVCHLVKIIEDGIDAPANAK